MRPRFDFNNIKRIGSCDFLSNVKMYYSHEEYDSRTVMRNWVNTDRNRVIPNEICIYHTANLECMPGYLTLAIIKYLREE